MTLNTPSCSLIQKVEMYWKWVVAVNAMEMGKTWMEKRSSKMKHLKEAAMEIKSKVNESIITTMTTHQAEKDVETPIVLLDVEVYLKEIQDESCKRVEFLVQEAEMLAKVMCEHSPIEVG